MLTTLPTLPELGNALEQGASAGLAGATSAVSTAASTSPLGTGGTLIAGLSVTKIVFILLGLILVAAGIFSFKETRSVLVTAGKAAAAV